MSGDEVFLEATLDNDGQLNTSSDEGWNIYHTCKKSSKAPVDLVTKMRASLNVLIDRIHPSLTFPFLCVTALPTKKFVMYILHGFTRGMGKIVEFRNLQSTFRM